MNNFLKIAGACVLCFIAGFLIAFFTQQTKITTREATINEQTKTIASLKTTLDKNTKIHRVRVVANGVSTTTTDIGIGEHSTTLNDTNTTINTQASSKEVIKINEKKFGFGAAYMFSKELQLQAQYDIFTSLTLFIPFQVGYNNIQEKDVINVGVGGIFKF